MNEPKEPINLDPTSFSIEDDVFEKEQEDPLSKLSAHERNYLLGIASIMGSTIEDAQTRRFRNTPQLERHVEVKYKVINMLSEEHQQDICALLSDNWQIAAQFQFQHTILLFMGKELWIEIEPQKPEQGETPPPAKD